MRFLRWVAPVGVASLVLSAGLMSPAQASRHRHHPGPGTVISAAPLPPHLWLPGTAAAHRLSYRSTSWSGRPTAEYGAVFLPSGPAPTGGWPVVTYLHGTTGVADPCAPSTSGYVQRDIDFLAGWLAAGYAVVAADYEGLGTPGTHPYLHGRSLAFGAVDLVRAARHAHPSLSNRYLAVGFSEGGLGALWTGSLAPRYAPELRYLGTAAIAPATQAHMTFRVIPIGPNDQMNPFWFYFLAGFAVTIPQFDPAHYLTRQGMRLYHDVLGSPDGCLQPLVDTIVSGGLTYADLTTLTPAKAERLADHLSAIGEIPVAAYSAPVLMVQGTADTTVYPLATVATAQQLQQAGGVVTLTLYPGDNHVSVVTTALPELLAFAASRVQSTGGRLP